MLAAFKFIDRAVKKTLTAFCAVLLSLMVAFTVYSVVMRYVFENPPVWGDLLTVLSNIWLVFFALALTVRDRDHIALDLIYSWLPIKVAFVIQQFWSVVIFGIGIVMIIYGLEAVAKMGGKYWEMWYFAWEDGGFVFKPNYMPKKYAISIVPISGFLVSVAALASILEDSLRLKAGKYEHSSDFDGDEGIDHL
ncbi:TRAP transporter small permease [Roseovarius sp. 217]|uniref:TRAP transporter small permease n=1 Tax=Roseovarius sp. (strain 217) TaxID=314264 RepID=UPI00006855A3|nr:TRAP transporter small permease [Roseovarius sp. 217]EAQ24854.1 TRAP dicarboxylate transporter, DctQ subunit [Roseovarius sp. 217]